MSPTSHIHHFARTARRFSMYLVLWVALWLLVPAVAKASVCSRTTQVSAAIVAAVSGKTDCADITDTDLAGLTGTLAVNNDSTLTSLKAGDFAGLTNLTALGLNNNGLTSLPANVFDPLTSLLDLNLHRNNSLSSLPTGVFDQLTSLTRLDMSNNSLSSLPTGVFDKLTSLTWLSLGYNSLSLAAGVFDKLTSLTTLYLQNASLSSLPTGVFDKLTSLTQLNLGSNSLSSLPTGVFDKTTSLTWLDIGANSLSSLPDNVFDKLTKLTVLYLSSNSLSSLPDNVFDQLTEVTTLWVNRNSLTALPAGVFDQQTKLTSLALSDNSLTALPANVFDKTTSLTKLWLHRNSLTTLLGSMFEPLTALTTLHLNGNTLTCLPTIPTSVTTLKPDNAQSTYTACPNVWVENIRWSSAWLDLKNWTGGSWSYALTPARGTACFAATSRYPVQQLELDSKHDYIVSVYSGTGCVAANLLDSESFSTPSGGTPLPTLSVSNITNTSATMALANHTGAWWYLETADEANDACKSVAAGTSSVDLTGLTANTSYQYLAYSAAGCDEATVPVRWITDQLNFTTTGPVSATVTDLTATSATLAISGLSSGQWSWRYLYIDPLPFPIEIRSPCRTLTHSTTSVEVTGLTGGTAYTFFVYRGDSCTFNDWITVKVHTISLVGGLTGPTQGTLTLAHHEGDWWYQPTGGAQATAAGGGCSEAVSGSTANLNGLTPGTQYTYTAYRAAGCASADELATTTFTTATVSGTPGTDTGGGGGGGGGGGDASAEQSPLQNQLESPANGATVSGIDLIRGWSFAEARGVHIAQVELYLDGQRAAVIPCCSTRPDVAQAYPDFPAANTGQSGWGITTNWGNLTPGSHTVRVVVTGTDEGRWVSEPHTITVLKAGNIAFADQFSLAEAEARLEGSHLVLDGVVIRDKVTQVEQEIVARYAWQTGAQGLRLVASETLETARVQPVGLDRLLAGLWQWGRGLFSPGSVTASPGLEMVYEAPADQARVAGIGLIQGWAFPEDEQDTIDTVTVQLGDAQRTSAPCCSARDDVAGQHPDQANALLSGWGLVFNYGNLPAGEHDIAVRIATEAGFEDAGVHTVTVSRLGGYAVVDRFDLSAATVEIVGEEIILSGVTVRDKASQEWQTIEVHLQWSAAAQGLVIVDTEVLS